VVLFINKIKYALKFRPGDCDPPEGPGSGEAILSRRSLRSLCSLAMTYDSCFTVFMNCALRPFSAYQIDTRSVSLTAPLFIPVHGCSFSHTCP
jgi:hypothetical protein